MSQTIEIEISGLHHDTHERLQEALGEQYEGMLENGVQDTIEDIYDQLTQAQEEAIAAQADDEDSGEE